MARHALGDHQNADDAEEGDVGQPDDQVELAKRAQPGKQRDTAGAADDAAGKERERQRDIERVAPPIRDRTGEGGGRHVRGDARHRHGRLHADEDQERRHQESAADAEHARQEPDCKPHRQHQEDVDGNVGDRKVDLHGWSSGAGLRVETVLLAQRLAAYHRQDAGAQI